MVEDRASQDFPKKPQLCESSMKVERKFRAGIKVDVDDEEGMVGIVIYDPEDPVSK